MKNTIKTEENSIIKIEKNLMHFGDTVLQLSNVSSVKVAPLPKTPYPLWALIIIAFGLFMFERNKMISFIAIIIGGLIIFGVYSKNASRGSYLVVTLNSGDSFFFSCQRSQFLYEAKNAIMLSFEGNAKAVINFQNCQVSNIGSINNSQIGGENNKYERK